MSKYDPPNGETVEALAKQQQLFNIMFAGQVVTPEMSPAQIKQLSTVMWATWRACCYANGVIGEGVGPDAKSVA